MSKSQKPALKVEVASKAEEVKDEVTQAAEEIQQDIAPEVTVEVKDEEVDAPAETQKAELAEANKPSMDMFRSGSKDKVVENELTGRDRLVVTIFNEFVRDTQPNQPVSTAKPATKAFISGLGMMFTLNGEELKNAWKHLVKLARENKDTAFGPRYLNRFLPELLTASGDFNKVTMLLRLVNVTAKFPDKIREKVDVDYVLGMQGNERAASQIKSYLPK